MQGIGRKWGRRGVWPRMLVTLCFCVSVGLKMIHKHETISDELVPQIWRRVDTGNRWKWM